MYSEPIKADEATLAVYCSDGANKQKPIVLVHGMPLNHEMWNFQISDLENKGYYVVAPDLRGFGESDRPEDNVIKNEPWKLMLGGTPAMYTLKQWAKDLNVILNDTTLDLQNVHLVGLSMGGAVVMQYMTDYKPTPDHVKKLTLVSAAGPSFGARMQRRFLDEGDLVTAGRLDMISTGFYGFMTTILSTGTVLFEDVVKMMFPYLLDCNPVVDGTKIMDWILKMFETVHPHAIVGACWDMRQDHEDLINNLKDITTPTKIIHGCWDPFVPFKLGQYVQTHLIPGTDTPSVFSPCSFGGHGLFFEQKDEFNKALDW
ncbi:MAG: alpha/beta fold hydrolase [Halobacteriota archaeon]